jgi:hypothetical protein
MRLLQPFGLRKDDLFAVFAKPEGLKQSQEKAMNTRKTFGI